MKDKINVAELLRNCPKGMELDCTMFDDVQFIDVNEADKPICIRTGDIYRYLTKFGTWTFDENAKCVIFPKGRTTWEGFQRPFRDGDVIFVCNNESGENFHYKYVAIFKEIKRGEDLYVHGLYSYNDDIFSTHPYLCEINTSTRIKFATEEQKEKLFNLIKINGYKWNAETKTLEVLRKPKFKVGDKVRHKDDKTVIAITGIKDDYYLIQFYNSKKNDYQNEKISFTVQDKYELIIDKFDITNLKPFDKVLMRSSNAREWVATFYSHYSNNKFYGCGMCCDQCIPYEHNEHLLGTTDYCDEFYKTWK